MNWFVVIVFVGGHFARAFMYAQHSALLCYDTMIVLLQINDTTNKNLLIHTVQNQTEFQTLFPEGKCEKTWSLDFGRTKIVSSVEFPFQIIYNLETHYADISGFYTSHRIEHLTPRKYKVRSKDPSYCILSFSV